MPPYIAYPRFLIELDISETSKLIYALLLDRARLSMAGDVFKDDFGKAYIYFTIETLAKLTNKSDMTVKNSLKILEENDLIKRIRQGLGLPSKIYVKIPNAQTERKLSVRSKENCTSDRQKTVPQTDRKLSTINNNINNNHTSIYGKFKNVRLSDDDINELKSSVPNYNEYIEKLSNYMESKGKTYKNHLLTIKNWASKEKPTEKRNYDNEEYKSL
ncbi:MAG: replication initiator protein A [Clostridia bacterium]